MLGDGPAEIQPPPIATTVRQVVAAPVLGGTLTVEPATQAIHLTRVGASRRFVGALSPVMVTDARGSLAGWTLAASFRGETTRVMRVLPAAAAVTGRPGEAAARQATTVRPGAALDLASAPAGGGGGQFVVGAEVLALDGPAGGPDHLDIPASVTLR